MPVRWRIGVVLGGSLLVALLAVALGFRLVGLGTVPEPIADEAFFGIQAARLVAGRPCALWTHSGMLVSPIQVGLLVPWLAVFEPAFWILRAPTALCGLLAIAVTFGFGRRVVDRETALVAAATFAVLPIAILYARDGCEYGLTPPFAMMALLAAFSGRSRALLVAALACVLIHPTNILLGPSLLGIHLARTLAGEPDRRTRIRRVVASVTVALLFVAVVGGMTLGRMGSHGFYAQFYRAPDWSEFARGLGRYLMGFVHVPPPSAEVGRRFDAVFWGAVAVVAAFGLPGLIRGRRWDRLALAAGLCVALVAFHMLTGPGVFSRDVHRYAAWLVAPCILTFAVLAREAAGLVEREVSAHLRAPLAALGITLAALTLVQVGRDHFGVRAGADVPHAWHALADRPGGLLQTIHDHLGETYPAGPRPRPDGSAPQPAARIVVAGNWWLARPLEYLATANPAMSVVAYDRPGLDAEQRLWNLLHVMEAGGCAVGFRGSELVAHVEALFPAERLETWEPDPAVLVYRVRPAHAEGPKAAAAAVADPTASVIR